MEVVITQESHPLLANAFKVNAGFVNDLNSSERMNVNGMPMSVARWNLIVSKRDITMWVKHGMKPHRGWKITAVKKYFGLKGSGEALLSNFMKLEAEIKSIMP